MTKRGLGNPNAVAVRVESGDASRAGGQKKHDLRKPPIPQYVDQDRMHLNSVISEPSTPAQLRAVCETRRSQRNMKRAMKANAGICFSGIITFGSKAQRDFEKLDVDAQNVAYLDVAQALAVRLNTTLTGLVIHRDETSPHAHFQMPGFDRGGIPLSTTVKRAVTSELQTIAANVMQKHVKSIERGKGKYDRLREGAKMSETVNRSVRQLHEDLPAEIAAAEEQRDFLTSEIEKHTGRIEKLKAKEDLTVRQAKTLENYERRLNNREDELSRLEFEAARLVKIANQTLSDAEEKALRLSQWAEEAAERANVADREAALLEARRDALRASVELREAIKGLPQEDIIEKLGHPIMRKRPV